MLTSHPSPDALDRYRRGLLPPEELLAVDDHLAACASCRETALRAAPAAGAVGLDTLLGGRAAEHPGFEELAAYVDGEQDDVAREVTEMHLADCASCREEVADLRGFKARVPVIEQATASSAAASGVGAGARGRRGLWLALALPAAAIVIWLLIPRSALSPFNRPPWSPVAPPTARLDPGAKPGEGAGDRPSPPPSGAATVATLRDGGRVVTLDGAGQVTGLPESLPREEQTMVMAALTTGRMAMPDLIREIAAEGEALRGSGVAMPFTLREPLGTAVEADRPRFRWDRLAAARAYIVSIYDEDFALVTRSPELASPEWTSDRPLARGKTYTWQVSPLATSDDTAAPARPTPSARFVVVTQQQAADLARIREAHSGEHLVMAMAYARAGVRDAAERELRALQRDNPDAAIVRRLLASLR